jgi:parallel beta-helix repeat protein
MTTYYVSSEIGSNNNAGTSQNAPLASLQAAANVVKPGDTVQVMNGTYTAPFYADALDITTSGTATAPITFEAAPGQTPVIDSSGGWNAINIEASYIVVKGFTVVGDAANYTLQSALAGYSTGSSSLDGNGIGVNPGSGASLPNHITIEDNTVYNEPGGGIYTEGADYVQILNNVVHNNANWSAFGNSGISISNSANSDTQSGVHDIISGNLVYDNAQLVPTNGAGGITDGEGIILDTNPNYTSEMLVENNTVYGNGGPGVESFLTNGAVITGNTVYGNDTQSTQAQSVAEIFINQSNDTVTNNDTANPNVVVPTISQGVLNPNDSVSLTGTAIAGSTVTVSDGGTSALGTTVASGNGSWSFTTLILAAGNPSFTATDTISIGTSAASNTLSLTVPTNAANTQTPAAPVINAIAENPNESITLTGTAVANSTVTVWSTTGNNDGTATASSSGAWSFTTPVLNLGIYGYYATDTTPGGTSAESNALGTQVVSDPANTTGTGSPPTAPGVAEILWQNTNGQAAIWEVNGTNVIADPMVGANPGPSWKAIGTGDFNDDGHSDILWQNTNGQAAIWEMNGTNVIAEAAVGANPGPSWLAIKA